MPSNQNQWNFVRFFMGPIHFSLGPDTLSSAEKCFGRAGERLESMEMLLLVHSLSVDAVVRIDVPCALSSIFLTFFSCVSNIQERLQQIFMPLLLYDLSLTAYLMHVY